MEGNTAILQGPPDGESQSSGAVENDVWLLNGMIKAHALVLERKLGLTIPSRHTIPPWIVEAGGGLRA